MKVTNQGPNAAPDLVVTDTLPAGSTFLSGSSSTGAVPTVQNGVATYQLGNLAAGASATITIVVQANTPGTLVNRATAASAAPNSTPGDSTVTQSTTVTATPKPPPPAPPTVLGLRREGFHRLPTSLVLTFSEDMNPGPAQAVSNYRLVAPGRDRRFGTRDDRSIAISSATYSPRSRTVTLAPRQRLNLHAVYQLTVNAGPGGLTSTAGIPLAGKSDQPGTDFVAVFQGFGTTDRGHPAFRSNRQARSRPV
jgi:hypothetical protein